MPAKANLRNPKHRQVLQAQLKEVNQKYILNDLEAILHYSISIHTCFTGKSSGGGSANTSRASTPVSERSFKVTPATKRPIGKIEERLELFQVIFTYL